MSEALETFMLLIEADGVITLPDEAVRHLGVEPGIETEIAYDVLPNGSIHLYAVSDVESASTEESIV